LYEDLSFLAGLLPIRGFHSYEEAKLQTERKTSVVEYELEVCCLKATFPLETVLFYFYRGE